MWKEELLAVRMQSLLNGPESARLDLVLAMRKGISSRIAGTPVHFRDVQFAGDVDSIGQWRFRSLKLMGRAIAQHDFRST